MNNQMTSNRDVLELKVTPHSIEAEQSVLGGIMLDNQVWDKVCDRLDEDDFYRYDHRVIYRTLSLLASRNSPFDVLTVTEALKEHHLLEEAGGEIYLFELAKNTPSAANAGAYADIVRQRSVLRQLISTSHEIAETAFNPGGKDTVELLDEAERRIFRIAERGIRGSGPRAIKHFLTKAVERIDELHRLGGDVTGIATGFTDLDEMTSGLQASDLVIIAGRPSMGKTVLGVNIAEYAVLTHKKPVLIFSMEMPGDAIVMRMLSSLGRINQHNLRTGKIDDDEWPRVTSGISMLAEVPLFIDDTPALSPAEVRARARRVVREHGALSLIVLDYMQLMQIPGYGENRTMEVSEISRSLKALAKELNVPVVALSQLNRGLEARHDKRPVMSDLRESGSIEQDADVIMFIYRDEVYFDTSPDKGTAEIIIAKQRNGPIGKVRLAFSGQYVRFDNLARGHYNELGVD